VIGVEFQVVKLKLFAVGYAGPSGDMAKKGIDANGRVLKVRDSYSVIL